MTDSDWIDITETHPGETPAGLAQRIVEYWKKRGIVLETSAHLEQQRRAVLRLVS